MANTYNPKKVQVIFNNQILTGFADGSFAELEMNADQFSLVVGADGEGARTASADRSGKLKVTLLQTSGGNDILSASLTTDMATNVNTGPCMIKDGSGRTLALAAQAWVNKYAAVAFDKEAKAREWTIESADWVVAVAGN
jgi:ATP-dependent protease HslVU (ClpYQ) peptidase subunit